METPMTSRPGAVSYAGEDRRQRSEDVWLRTLRIIARATYIILIINLFAFLAVSTQDYSSNVAGQVAGVAPAPPPGREAYFNAFLPIMAVGLLVGVAGILIDRKRTRRRRDRSYKSQLACIIFSAIGVGIYFILL